MLWTNGPHVVFSVYVNHSMQTSQVLLFVVKNEKKFEKTFNCQIFQHACTNVLKMHFTNQL